MRPTIAQQPINGHCHCSDSSFIGCWWSFECRLPCQCLGINIKCYSSNVCSTRFIIVISSLTDYYRSPAKFNGLSTIKVELFNARSIKNKLHDFHYLLQVAKPDVVCITETWLNSSISDNLLVNDSSYCVFRTDRHVSKAGGGVCILTNNNSINAVSISLPTKYVNLEMCVIDILTDSCSIRLLTVIVHLVLIAMETLLTILKTCVTVLSNSYRLIIPF